MPLSGCLADPATLGPAGGTRQADAADAVRTPQGRVQGLRGAGVSFSSERRL